MRAHFLLDPDVVFLNHGSYGACPIEGLAARRKWEDEMERNPVEFLGRRSAGLLRASREALGAFVGALPFDPDAFADQVIAAISPRTRLLFVSHIASTTALRLPAAHAGPSTPST